LPTRLENALILANDTNEAKALGVIRDAGKAASRARVGAGFSNAFKRRNLFKVKNYPLAWGNRTVEADVFITGLVTNTGERDKTTVQLEFITKDDPSKLQRWPAVPAFSVETDLGVLRDLGYNFTLPGARVMKRSPRAALAAGKAKRRDGDGAPAEKEVSPSNIAGMAVKIFYNGKEQPINPLSQGGKSKEFQVAPIAQGTKVAMSLTRVVGDGKKLGAVLKINGRSSYKEETEDAIRCRKWIYDPEDKGKPDKFAGFYSPDPGNPKKLQVREWEVLSEEESRGREAELGERVGWIDVDVFASGPDREA